MDLSLQFQWARAEAGKSQRWPLFRDENNRQKRAIIPLGQGQAQHPSAPNAKSSTSPPGLSDTAPNHNAHAIQRNCSMLPGAAKERRLLRSSKLSRQTMCGVGVVRRWTVGG